MGKAAAAPLDGVKAQKALDQKLMAAVRRGSLKGVRRLLADGANPRASDQGCLYRAIVDGRVDILELMLDQISNLDTDPLLPRCLACAAARGCAGAVNLLLDRGVPVNGRNGTALYNAAFHDRKDMVHLLLDRGADVHAGDDAAFFEAAAMGLNDIAALLLDRGANIHARDDQALFNAVETGRHQMVALLLHRGANPRARDDRVLIYSAMLGRDTIVALLLNACEDSVQIGARLLEVAIEHDADQVIEILLRRRVPATHQSIDAAFARAGQGRPEAVFAFIRSHDLLATELTKHLNRELARSRASCLKTVKEAYGLGFYSAASQARQINQ